MSYYGQYPFNTNGGALLSKRNYINRKLDEIEQKLLQLGWIEPEQDISVQEEITDEYDMPVESAGALIPYRDKVNKRLDFFEEIINSHIGSESSPYSSNNYGSPYSNQNITLNEPRRNDYYTPKNQFTPEQEEVKKSFESRITDLFG